MSWDVLSAATTPALERLSFEKLDDALCDNLEEVFAANNDRTVGFQANRIFDHDDEEPYQICDHYPRARIRQILLPMDSWCGGRIREQALSLRKNPQITHLGLWNRFDYPSDNDLLQEETSTPSPLSILCDLLGSLPNLEALWLRYGPHETSYHSISSKYAARLEAAIFNMSRACCTLRYVRIGTMGWHVYPSLERGNAPKLVMLDEWTDQMEGPAFFRVPKPLPWAYGLHHIEA